MADTDSKTVSIDEFNELKAQLTQADERAKRFEGLFTDLEKRFNSVKDIDPVAYKAMQEDYDNLRKQAATGDKDEIDRLLADKEKQITTRFETKLTELQSLTDRLQSENKELKVVDRAMETIGGRFNDDTHGFIKQYVRQAVDRGESGDFVVKDDAGNVRYSKQNPSKPLTLEEFADELAEKHPSLARANVPAGGVQNGQRLPSGAQVDLAAYLNPSKHAQMDTETRHKLGPQAADRLVLTQGGLRFKD